MPSAGGPGWGPDDRRASEPSYPYAPPRAYYPAAQQGWANSPAEPGYPRSAGGGPTRIVIIVVAVLAVVLTGVVVWQFSQRETPRAGPVPGELTREFPTAPSAAWTVTADQLGASALTLSSAVGDGFYAFPPALVDDGGIAVSVAATGGSDSKHVVAGVNMATGTSWTTHVPAQCPAQIARHLIACETGTGEAQQYGFLDVRDGSQAGTAAVPPGVGGTAAFDGDALYLTGGANNGSGLRVTKLDRAGNQAWSVTPDVPTRSGPGFTWINAGRGVVGASMNGADLVVSAADGHVISKNVGAGQVLADGSLIGSVNPDGQGVPRGYEIVHPDGTTTELSKLDNPLNGSYGPTQQQPAVTSRALAGIAMLGGRLYRPGATTPTWAAATPISRVVLVTDRLTVGVTDTGALHGYDTTTGQEIWAGADGVVAPPTSKYVDNVITDGIRIIALAADGTLTAIDAATGNQAWTMQGPTPTASARYYSGGSEKPAAYLYAAGDKFVVVTGNAITAYGATGGPASEPGSRSGAGAQPGQNGGGYYTRCGSAPIFTPQKFRTAGGGLIVTVKVTAKCPGGDVLGSAGTTLTIHDDTGLIASGTFDFSSAPIGVAPPSGSGAGGTVIELTFPPGSFWRLPDTLGADSAGANSAAGVTAKPGILVECERPKDGAAQATNPPAAPSATASPGYTPSGTDIGTNCSQALRSQADSDRSFISTKLNGNWLAQLSSKRAGLEADGKTWDDCAILHEFLALRLRFTDVRMLWSDEWSVFSNQGWWVTVAAATFPGPDEANGWCQQQGFDHDHCFAKLISTSAGPDGSTKYWN